MQEGASPESTTGELNDDWPGQWKLSYKKKKKNDIISGQYNQSKAEVRPLLGRVNDYRKALATIQLMLVFKNIIAPILFPFGGKSGNILRKNLLCSGPKLC